MANRLLIDNVAATGSDVGFVINGTGTLVCEITGTATVEIRAFLVEQDKFIAFDTFTASGVKTRSFAQGVRLEAAVTARSSGNISLEIND